jgi:hypothetical protein
MSGFPDIKKPGESNVQGLKSKEVQPQTLYPAQSAPSSRHLRLDEMKVPFQREYNNYGNTIIVRSSLTFFDVLDFGSWILDVS